MVIGIPCPGKRTAGGSRGFSAPSARPFRPYSNRLLRRRSGFLRGLGSGAGSVGSGIGAFSGSVSSGSARVGSGVGGGVDRSVRGGSSGIARRFGGSGSGIRSSSSVGSGLILLGATGTQHEGNRNGAPDLCIHRQLPQYVSENYSAFSRSGQLTRGFAVPSRACILAVMHLQPKVAALRH